jgi:hypothetical protein
MLLLDHVGGLPVEETVLALVPAGAAIVAAVVFAARARLERIDGWRRHR